MPKYRFTYPIRRARGYQIYEVEAASEDEAREKVKDAECVDEEIEVESLDEPEIEIVED